MQDLIVLGGAPGSEKSTVAALLQRRLGTPLFEFGWIPEFRFPGSEHVGFAEEESLAFENLCLVVRNYLAHGFRNVVVTDLGTDRVAEVRALFADRDVLLVTLRMADEAELRRRVLEPSRSSAYRDVDGALAINAALRKREPLPGERFLDGARSPEDLVREILVAVEDERPAAYGPRSP